MKFGQEEHRQQDKEVIHNFSLLNNANGIQQPPYNLTKEVRTKRKTKGKILTERPYLNRPRSRPDKPTARHLNPP